MSLSRRLTMDIDRKLGLNSSKEVGSSKGEVVSRQLAIVWSVSFGSESKGIVDRDRRFPVMIQSPFGRKISLDGGE